MAQKDSIREILDAEVNSTIDSLIQSLYGTRACISQNRNNMKRLDIEPFTSMTTKEELRASSGIWFCVLKILNEYSEHLDVNFFVLSTYSVSDERSLRDSREDAGISYAADVIKQDDFLDDPAIMMMGDHLVPFKIEDSKVCLSKSNPDVWEYHKLFNRAGYDYEEALREYSIPLNRILKIIIELR